MTTTKTHDLVLRLVETNGSLSPSEILLQLSKLDDRTLDALVSLFEYLEEIEYIYKDLC